MNLTKANIIDSIVDKTGFTIKHAGESVEILLNQSQCVDIM